MSERQLQFVRNVLSNYATNILGAVAFIVLTPFIIAQLGPEAYGIWILIHALGHFVNYLDLGFDDAMLKLQSEFDGQQNALGIQKLIGTGITLYLGIGVLACCLLLMLAALDVGLVFNVPENLITDFNLVIVLLAFNLLISFPTSVVEGVIEGFQRFDIANVIDIAFLIVGSVATVVILLLDFGIVGLAIMELVLSVVSLFVHLIVVKRRFPSLSLVPRFDGAIWKKLRSFGLWSFLDDLVTEGAAQIDKLIIPLFFSVSMLTPYSLFMALATLVLMVSEPLTDVFFPLASELKAKLATPKLKQLLYGGTRLVIYVVSPVAIVVSLFGGIILEVWVGKDYTEAAPVVLSLLVANFFVSAFIWPATTMLMGMGLVRRVFWFTAIEILVALLLIVTLAPFFGILGFALGLVLSNVICALVLTMPAICKEIHMPVMTYLFASVLRPILVSVPTLGVAVLLATAKVSPTIFELVLIFFLVISVQLISVMTLGISTHERILLRRKLMLFKERLNGC